MALLTHTAGRRAGPFERFADFSYEVDSPFRNLLELVIGVVSFRLLKRGHRALAALVALLAFMPQTIVFLREYYEPGVLPFNPAYTSAYVMYAVALFLAAFVGDYVASILKGGLTQLVRRILLNHTGT